MNFVILLLCLVVVVVAQDKYEDEDFDISEVLEKLPEALATRCSKCTDRQKQLGKQLAKEVKRTRPDLWKELVAFYDPQGKYQEAFQDYLKP